VNIPRTSPPFGEHQKAGSQAAQSLLRKETYLRIFTDDKPYHTWELQQPPTCNGAIT
jgi:hypothetical protein